METVGGAVIGLAREPSGLQQVGDRAMATSAHAEVGEEGGSESDEDDVDGNEDEDGDEEENDEELEEDEDDPVPLEDAKQELYEALEAINSSGSFAAFGAILYLPDPHITLDAGGAIMLPLTTRDAQSIIAASHQAPFGRGTETIVDQRVRKTWELNHDQFTIQNAAFHAYRDKVLGEACKGLGITNQETTQAQLYKLLLYEPGAMFKPHTDPGHVRHARDKPPSTHSGGMLKLSHDGAEMQFQTSSYTTAWGAWYSDVRHEVTPVVSGYRLVLTFNLVQPAAFGAGHGVAYEQRYPELRDAMCVYAKSCADNTHHEPTLYALEHKYTEVSISLTALKGNDLVKTQALRHFAATKNMVLYLGFSEKFVTGGAEENDYGYGRKRRRYGYDDYGGVSEEYREITEEHDSSLKITRLVDLDGKELAKDLPISEEDFLMEAPYEDRTPTENHYEGYTGNAGATASHWYRDTVVVMIPAYYAMKLRLRGQRPYGAAADKEIMTLLAELAQTYSNSDKKASQTVVDIGVVTQHIFATNEQARHQYSSRYAESTVDFAYHLLTSLARRKFANMRDPIRAPNCLLAGQRLSLKSLLVTGQLIGTYALAELTPLLRVALVPYGTLEQRLEALKATFGDGFERATSLETQEFIRTSVLQLMPGTDATSVSALDGGTLAEMVLLDPLSALFRDSFQLTVLPHVRTYTSDTRFAVSFLAVWGSKGATKFDMAYVTTLYADVGTTMLKKFRIDFKAPAKSDVAEAKRQAEKLGKDLAIVWQHTNAGNMPLTQRDLLLAIGHDTL